MPEMKVDMGASGTKTVEVNYPSNSHKKIKEEKEEPKKVNKIVSGSVVQRKKSLGKRMVETFVGEDIVNVKSYVIHDVLIPAAKNALTDMVQGGIEMLLFGGKKSDRSKRDKGRSYVSYNNYSKQEPRRDQSNRNRASHNFDDIVLDSRGDAEEVLSNLVMLIEDYGQATVGDLYDLVGITSNFTDNKYGWKNLNSSYVERVRDGYLINLPRTILLD